MPTKLLNYSIGLAFIILTFFIGYQTDRNDFVQLMILYFGLFALYIVAYRNTKSQETLHLFIGIAIAVRLLLVFSIPNLSDDIFRFIWDGKLWHAGINPFDALPSYYAENGFPEGINQTLYQQLNSPNYFTIYPPVAQLTFYVATFARDTFWSSVVMKLFLFAAEIGSIWLLLQLFNDRLKSQKRILLFALNPLIIIEVMGNLHFEGVMIFFLLLAYYWLKKGWINLSAIAFAFSVASKLLPLMFLPFLIHKLGWKRSFQYFTIVGVVTVGLFYPLLGSFFIENFGNSLNLYFQKFEFNASIYYALRWLGFQLSGYNLIQILGPILALSVGVSIFYIALKDKSKRLEILPEQWLLAIMLYLFCTTTVHPWYTALPIVLCLFTNYRFPIVWSALIFLTYVNYSYETYFENLWIVALEYILMIGYLIYEIRIKENTESVK
ncbi:MAG: glycosyltransferase 87 family protein [Saprospiraceae bacterium]